MAKLILALVLLFGTGSVTQAQAPPKDNGVTFTTVCTWDLGCLTYKVLKGIWTLWK